MYIDYFRRKDYTKKVMEISGDVIEEAENFKHLRSFITRDVGLMRNVKYMIKCGWMK